MNSFRHLSLVIVCLLGLALGAAEPTIGSNGWTNMSGVVEGTITTCPVDTTLPKPPLGYVVYLPKGYNATDPLKKWPVVVYLAGVGEIGNGTNTAANGNQLYKLMIKHGPLHQVISAKWDFPSIIIAPQSPGYWNNATILLPVFEYAKANYRVDANRMYLTGLCDGGVGTLHFAAQHPGYLAGIMPIEASAMPTTGEAAGLKNLPMWAVHCFNDPIIARTSSVVWVDQASQADVGTSDVMLTYPGYAGKIYHTAVDADPVTHLAIDPLGPTTWVSGCTLTNGSTWVGFPSGTTFGSATFNTWGGTDAWPYNRVSVGPAPDAWVKSGVMLRDTTASGSPEVLVAQGPNNEVFMQWRSNLNGTTTISGRVGGTGTVKWVKLAKAGSTFTGSYSLDGTTWTTIASQSVSFNATYLGGLAVTARNNSTTYTQTFTNLTIGGTTPGVLTDADIGSPGKAGSASVANGTWTVTGGGGDINSTVDQFHYNYTSLSGDQTIIARVGNNTPTNVIALGKPNGFYLTRPYTGPTAVRGITLQIPVGYNATSYFDPVAKKWTWQRNQIWDQTKAQKRIFTMFWYDDHVQGWVETWSNGSCWDWLYSQSKTATLATPVITVHPQSQSVPEGQSATFSVAASGSAPLTYQWTRNGTAIAGATTASYGIATVSGADSAAQFAVTVTNAAGSVTSAVAVLTVVTPPPAGEPYLAINGWTNAVNVVEGAIHVRPVDNALPRPPYGYLDYLPLGYNPANPTVKWPLIVYLTNTTEAGDGTNTVANGNQLYNQLVKYGPLSQVIKQNWDFPAIIVVPQVTTNWTKPLNVKNIVEYAKANYQVDVNRIYMTGNGEGASGTLRYAVAYPTDLTGILTIEANTASSAAQATTIKSLPMWAVHSFADQAISRSVSIGWMDALAVANFGGTSDVMLTYPGYRDRNHFAVDTDPVTRKPLNMNGAITTIAGATVTNGSKSIVFPTGVTFGSTVFNLWGGSIAQPFAQVRIAGDPAVYLAGGGTSTSINLTNTYPGISVVADITIQTPVGYNASAYRDAVSGAWAWSRDQTWDQAHPDQQILTLFWYQSPLSGWTQTWGNVQTWNWLFTQVKAPGGSG